jgi:hypothetical protein
MEIKHCTKCNSDKPLTEEFWHHRKSKKDGWEYYCKACVRETTKANYNKNKDQWREYQKEFKRKYKETVNEYKQTLCCSKCKETRYYLLDFHHIDPTTKSIAIGNAWQYKSIEDTFKEIEKCIPLCSNCHREFHYLERNTKITIEDYLKIKN